MGAVFHVFDLVAKTEVYLLTNWGGVTSATWQSHGGVYKEDDTTYNGVCQFNQDNLVWSA